MALAAAEVVAALKKAPPSILPGELQDYLSKSRMTADQSLVDLALQAVERVKTNSELKELWEEGDTSEWYAVVSDLEARLRQ